jgi:hypothetical protein
MPRVKHGNSPGGGGVETGGGGRGWVMKENSKFVVLPVTHSAFMEETH